MLPLVFDRRDKDRETALLKSLDPVKGKWKKPFLLLALDGVSSPFPHSELLRELVTLRFGKDYHIIEIPKAERIYDLLALYEQSALLIAVDSAPLHLAWACRKLPVFALTNDNPTLWKGASWRPNMSWYCRYSDFPSRAVEMLEAVQLLAGLEHFEPTHLKVWSQPEPTNRRTWCRDSLTIVPGMCGRDSANTLKDDRRFPYLRDVLRMQRFRRRVKDDVLITLQPSPNVIRC